MAKQTKAQNNKPEKRKNELHGVRVAAFVLAIIELVGSALTIIMGIVFTIIGAVLFNEPVGSITPAGVEKFVFLGLGIAFLVLSILGLICAIKIIKLTKHSHNHTQFIVFGVLGIISLSSLISGILCLVSAKTCKNKPQTSK